MNRRQFIVSAGVSSSLSAAPPSSMDKFIGVWKLIRCEQKSADGTVTFPYGQPPEGRISYDKAGRMSAILMQPGRHSTVPPGVGHRNANVKPEELFEAANGFSAYYGSFEIDESTQTVIHHVKASLVPSWVGTDLRRTFQFNGNRLLLSAKSAGGTLDLTWERESD